MAVLLIVIASFGLIVLFAYLDVYCGKDKHDCHDHDHEEIL